MPLIRPGRKRGLVRPRRSDYVILRQGAPLPKPQFGTYWVTPQQAVRERRQQSRQITGIVVGASGWLAALFLSSYGPIALLPAVTAIVLFTVLGVVIAFSQSDKE